VDRCLKKALLRNEDLLPAILEQEQKMKSSAWLRTSAERSRAAIVPNVGVYHELSLHHTIIEIQCEDRIGLLYRVAKAIFDHGFDISFARIATERGVAMDTFYIEQIDNRYAEKADLLELRKTLTYIVCEGSLAEGQDPMRKKAQ
jgi:[protein-PII] uridylyltransferase